MLQDICSLLTERTDFLWDCVCSISGFPLKHSVSDIMVLNDDKQFYPSYQCGNIVRSEILKRFMPV